MIVLAAIAVLAVWLIAIALLLSLFRFAGDEPETELDEAEVEQLTQPYGNVVVLEERRRAS